MLAGCSSGGSTPLNPLPAQRTPGRSHPSVAYAVICSFDGYDGKDPVAALINVKGTLYGTTEFGGANNEGTVFSITTSGAETVLHSFAFSSSDGGDPVAALTNVNGTLYGTTEFGGAYFDGTVFEIVPFAAEGVLHSFGGAGDGELPIAALINVNGTLYGTTYAGGAYYSYNAGTVFSITRSGSEAVLHSFGSYGDGNHPSAALIDVKGTLYGTTEFGGAYYQGTVFKVPSFGAYSVIYSFGVGSADAAYPQAALIGLKGTLYGTTSIGGANGNGTVFSITPSGAEAVVHSFGGSADGANPVAPLIKVQGTLYGTTEYGGAYNDGTVFSIAPSGAEAVLHSFGGSGDGANPRAALIDVKGTLYGTTEYGGANGDGTVFSLTP
jgi:uncharacterized repeat protein (TIGR03803 family)